MNSKILFHENKQGFGGCEKAKLQFKIFCGQDSVPSVVNLMGNKADLSSSTLAQRLGE